MSDEQKPITVTYPDATTASRVVDLVVRKRPLGWSRKSYATYFREEYALQMKRELDSLISSRTAKLFPYEHFPNMSSTSLYLRINQSVRYVLEFLDPDGRYAKLWSEVRTEKVKGRGVVIKFRDFVTDDLKGEDFVAKADKVKWKQKIDLYLEGDEMKPLHIDHLLLSSSEIDEVKAELDGVEGIQFSVSSKEIKIVKTV